MAYYATYMPNELGELQKVVINAGVGFVLPFYGETAPPGTLACDGSEISRTVYDELFQVLGTKAGAGDGSTTFNLPDLRGQFVRGMGGNAAALGVTQGDAIRNISGNFRDFVYQTLNDSAWTNGRVNNVSGCFWYNPDIENNCQAINMNASFNGSATGDGTYFSADRVVPTATENRPVNVALLWCIIYE